MRLLPLVTTTYRCATCDTLHPSWPEHPCCQEAHERREADELLTIAEVAERAKVAKSTVTGWVNRRLLRATRVDTVVRVREQDLETFLSEYATVR